MAHVADEVQVVGRALPHHVERQQREHEPRRGIAADHHRMDRRGRAGDPPQDKAADTVREKRKGNCDQGGNPCAEPGVGEYLFDHQAVVVFAWVVVSFSG